MSVPTSMLPTTCDIFRPFGDAAPATTNVPCRLTTDCGAGRECGRTNFGALRLFGGEGATVQRLNSEHPEAVGRCPEDADLLGALDAWVEDGTAPGDLVAYKILPGRDAPAPFRPLCRYPTYPRYAGTGDPNDASSFVCADADS